MKTFVLLAAYLATQTAGVPVAPNCTVAGTVLDAASGTPLADVQVSSGVPNSPYSTTTDTGQYKLTGLNPGAYRISAHDPGRDRTVYKYVYLDPGQTLNIDLHLPPESTISGRIVDEKQNPVPNQPVVLIRSEYQFGVLGHVADRSVTTRTDGTYGFDSGLESGRAYLILAPRFNLSPDAPADREQRSAVLRTTYFPDAPALDGAIPITLQPGEHRERADVHMSSSRPLCADGLLQSQGKPGSASFAIGLDALLGMPEYHASSTPEGRFHVCGFSPGRYGLVVNQWDGREVYGAAEIQISSSDVREVHVDSAAGSAPRLDVGWDGPAPPGDARANIHLAIVTATGRVAFEVEKSFPMSGALPIHLPAGDYRVDVRTPVELYIKQMSYGGTDILHHEMKFSGADGDNTLRIVVGRDGGTLSITVSDADAHAVPAATVLIFPDAVSSVASLAARLVVGQADQKGGYVSPTLAPGKYDLLACRRTISYTPEDLDKIFDARSHASSVDLGPKATASATIQPAAFE